MAMRTRILVGGDLWQELQRKGVKRVDEFFSRAQEWINLEEARAAAIGTSQAPIQPIGAVTDVVATTQPITQNNQAGNNKRKGNGEGDQNGMKKNKFVQKIQAHLCHLHRPNRHLRTYLPC